MLDLRFFTHTIMVKIVLKNLESCIVWSKFPEKLILSTHSQWFFINIMLIKLTDQEIFVINLFKCFAWLLVTYIICVKLKRIVIYSRNNLEFVNEVSKVLSLSRDIHYCKFWISKKSDFDTCRAMLNSQMFTHKIRQKENFEHKLYKYLFLFVSSLQH